MPSPWTRLALPRICTKGVSLAAIPSPADLYIPPYIRQRMVGASRIYEDGYLQLDPRGFKVARKTKLWARCPSLTPQCSHWSCRFVLNLNVMLSLLTLYILNLKDPPFLTFITAIAKSLFFCYRAYVIITNADGPTDGPTMDRQWTDACRSIGVFQAPRLQNSLGHSVADRVRQAAAKMFLWRCSAWRANAIASAW